MNKFKYEKYDYTGIIQSNKYYLNIPEYGYGVIKNVELVNNVIHITYMPSSSLEEIVFTINVNDLNTVE